MTVHDGRRSGSSSAGDSHPPSFVCPLTMQVMEDPVMDHCAHNFERSAIVKWLNEHESSRESSHVSCCPISRKPLDISDLVPNHKLAERIERWKWQNEQSGGIEMSHSCSETVGSHESAEGIVQVNVSVGDVESGNRKVKRFGKHKRRRGTLQYESVPAGLILLPQERAALQLARTKAMEHDYKEWKTRCWRLLIASVLVTFSIALIIFGVSRVLKEKEDDEMR